LIKVLSFLFICQLLFISCKETKYSVSENENASTIKELNSKNYSAVINKYSVKEDSLTEEERYYYASAYAMKAGADIFAIYPILEIQLFHRSAIDWDELEAIKNPYEKFVKSDSKKAEFSVDKRKDAWLKYEEDFREYRGISDQFECENKNEYIEECKILRDLFEEFLEKVISGKVIYVELVEGDLSEAQRLKEEVYQFYSQIVTPGTNERQNFYELVQKRYDEIVENKKSSLSLLKSEEGVEVIFDEASYRKSIENLDNNFLIYVHSEIEEISYGLYEHLEIEAQLHADKKEFLLGVDDNSENSQMLMNLAWKMYESIPIIKRLPIITVEQQKELGRALEELKRNLLIAPDHNKSKGLMVLLLSFSFTSIFADSFELEAVKSPFELGCHLNGERFLDYHKIIIDRMTFLTELEEVYPEVAIEYKKQLTDLKNYLRVEGDELTQEERDQFLMDRKAHELESCDASIYLYK
jgi:hypothetical protein